jgi:hypothetical protein
MENCSPMLMNACDWELFWNKLWFKMMTWATSSKIWQCTRKSSIQTELSFSRRLINTRLKSSMKIIRRMTLKDNWCRLENMSNNCMRNWRTFNKNNASTIRLIKNANGNKSYSRINQKKWTLQNKSSYLWDRRPKNMILYTLRTENSSLESVVLKQL